MKSDPSLDAGYDSFIISGYHPPGMSPTLPPPAEPVEWVRNSDGTVLMDHRQRPVSVNRLLATKPLRRELSTRPGPCNRKLTYISGDGVTRTLNDIFGHDGWNLDIKQTKREECVKDDKHRFHVAYTATVRVTHRKSGSYREDCGAGDATDRSMGTAVANALKASITDAMKRAARHFGDKLGNSLYQDSFSISNAPVTLEEALDKYDAEVAKSKFPPAKLHDEKPIVRQMPTAATSHPETKMQVQQRTSQPPPTNPQFTDKAHFPMQTPPMQSNSAALPPVATPQMPTPVASNNQMLPPPTFNQRLQSSGLFGSSVFADGRKTEEKENGLPDFGIQRPSTSTGRKSFDPAGKRPFDESLQPLESRKKANVNPYRP